MDEEPLGPLWKERVRVLKLMQAALQSEELGEERAKELYLTLIRSPLFNDHRSQLRSLAWMEVVLVLGAQVGHLAGGIGLEGDRALILRHMAEHRNLRRGLIQLAKELTMEIWEPRS